MNKISKTVLTALVGIAPFAASAQNAEGPGKDPVLQVGCLGSQVRSVDFYYNHRDASGGLDAEAKMGTSAISFSPVDKQMGKTAFFSDYRFGFGETAGMRPDEKIDVTKPGNEKAKALAMEMMKVSRDVCSKHDNGDMQTVIEKAPNQLVKLAKTIL